MDPVRSYLTYIGPGDLRVEMGLCTAVPVVGASVIVDGKHYVVKSIGWDVFTGEDEPSASWAGHDRGRFPQQHATVTLRRK